MARSRSAPWATMRLLRSYLSRTRRLYHYFKQLFAQVTNPPIDPIREELVTSLVSFIGPKPNLLGIDEMNPPLRLEISQPVLDFFEMEKIRHIDRYTDGKFKSFEIDTTYPIAWGKEAIEARLASLCAQAEDAVRAGYLGHRHLRPQNRARSASRFRRCSPCRRSTSTSSTRVCAPARVSWSRPARRARCITSRCSAATAPRRCTLTSLSRRCSISPDAANSGRAWTAGRRSRTTSRRSARG